MLGSVRHEALGLVWPAPLLGYQEIGMAWLLEQRSALLADEMGLGKTVQTIAALRLLARQDAVRRALVVCTAGLILQWRRHLRQWAPELGLSTVMGTAEERVAAWARDATVYLTGYESLRSDGALRTSGAPFGRLWDVVVIDEGQRIKNPDADVSIAIKRLRRVRSWALTGTPIENRLDDLISILDFVAPGRFDRAAMAVGLRRLLGEVQLRRRRRDVLADLPPKQVATVMLELSPGQQRAYRRALDEGLVRLRALGRDVRISHVLELILRLKQICNFCPETDASAKLDDLRDRLGAVVDAGEKALVFSQFVEEPFGARRLARELARYAPILFTGDLDPITRAARVAEFERHPARPVMILSLRAGSLGLNLTAASRVFHFDRWWNPALEAQAEDRVHRIGQIRPVQVFAYLSADTIEERIDAVLAEKRALFADMVEGVSAAALRRLDLDALLSAVGAARGCSVDRAS
jgi:SNF2 family DNA or RNA helicase